MLMSESIGYLQRLSSTIEYNLPAIRADQNIMMSQTIFSTLGTDAQASIMNEELQAQNAVFMAIAALNSQLEQLIEEVNDCPEADEEGPFPGFGDNKIGVIAMQVVAAMQEATMKVVLKVLLRH